MTDLSANDITGRTGLICILGSPVAHSISPAMRAGYALGVKPPVIAVSERKSYLLVLVIVFAHIDVETV